MPCADGGGRGGQGLPLDEVVVPLAIDIEGGDYVGMDQLARQARYRGVLAKYAAGSGTQREGMQRRSNASVFMKRGT